MPAASSAKRPRRSPAVLRRRRRQGGTAAPSPRATSRPVRTWGASRGVGGLRSHPGLPNADRLTLTGNMRRGDVGLCPGVSLETMGRQQAASPPTSTSSSTETGSERANAATHAAPLPSKPARQGPRSLPLVDRLAADFARAAPRPSNPLLCEALQAGVGGQDGAVGGGKPSVGTPSRVAEFTATRSSPPTLPSLGPARSSRVGTAIVRDAAVGVPSQRTGSLNLSHGRVRHGRTTSLGSVPDTG